MRRVLDGVVRTAKRDSNQLQQVITDLPFAVLVANDHGAFVMVNDAAAALTGYSRAELQRLSVWQLTPDVHEHEAETLWRAFLQQSEQSGTYRLLRKDGTTILAPYVAKTNVIRGHHVSVLGEPFTSSNLLNR